MKNNRPRRKFLSYLGIAALLFSMPITLFASHKIESEEEYIFVNGWLLKKKDLNDL